MLWEAPKGFGSSQDLGSRVGAAASVCADRQPAGRLSLSLPFRLQVSEPVCRGPITYQVLTLAGPARYSCSANKQNLLIFSQPCKHPLSLHHLPLQLASRPVCSEAVAIEAQCPWGHNDQLVNIKLPKSWWLLLVTVMKFFYLYCCCIINAELKN